MLCHIDAESAGTSRRACIHTPRIMWYSAASMQQPFLVSKVDNIIGSSKFFEVDTAKFIGLFMYLL